MKERSPENKQKMVDFLVKSNFPADMKHREVRDAVKKELGFEYGENYVGIVRNEIRQGKVKPSKGVTAGPPYNPSAQKPIPDRPAAKPTADPNPPKDRMDDKPPTRMPRLSAVPAIPADVAGKGTPDPAPTADTNGTAAAHAPAEAKVLVEPQQVFNQIKAVKTAIAACGGEENLKKMIELMKEHGI